MSEDHDDNIIDRIETIRAANNSLWMELLRIAIEAEPNVTKDVLREINKNDLAISELLQELAK